MRIGVIGAIEIEIEPFIASMNKVKTEEHAMLKFHQGQYRSIDIVALFCGVCKVNAAIAAQILVDKYQVENIIVVGTAGAIDDKLHLLDTVISAEVGYHDVAGGILTEYHPWMKSVYFTADERMIKGMHNANADDPSVVIGRIMTGEAFIDQHGRKEIIQAHNPLCVDMETAGIAHVCYANSIPFAAIRSMSDTPHESGDNAFRQYGKAAAEKSVKVLKRYLDLISN